MSKEIVINVETDLTRVAVLEDRELVEMYIEKSSEQRSVGNIYKGKVANVLPGMQAAFIDIGAEKNAFLYISDAIPLKNTEDLEEELIEHLKRATINDVLRVGQEVMVQVIKESMGTKGARVTTHITLPGRFLVLMPNVDYIGVSRKIEEESERERLKRIAEGIKPDGMGLIVRTVAEGKNSSEIKQDIEFLTKLWQRTKQKMKNNNSPRLIHRDLNLLYRTVRDYFSSTVDRLIVNNKWEYEKIIDLLETMSPHLISRVELYNKDLDIFDFYRIENNIEKLLSRRVWLKSGGYIVIDHTEALTVIDVNTGKFVGSINLADTVLRTNLEAAEEIARQLRLRDIGGIIIVDFIDMTSPHHKELVLEELEKHLKKDNTKASVLGITQLGLVEITRKKVRVGLTEALQKPCPICSGKGRVLSEDTMAKKVEREIKKIFSEKQPEAILLEVEPHVAAVVIGPGGAHLTQLEEQYKTHIFVKGSKDVHPEEIRVRAIGDLDRIQTIALPVKEGEVVEVLIEEQHASNPRDGIGRIEGYIISVDSGGILVGKKVFVEIIKTYKTYAKGRLVY